MKQLMNKIPLWVINALSVISGILTIITSFISIFTIYINWEKSNKMVFATLCCFIVLLSIRVRKYQKLAFDRQLTTSFVYHRLTHVSRDLFFEVMRLHKEKSENVRNLTSNYQNQLSILLTHLCDMMEKYCGQKTSSCIKLITRQESEIKNITLTTFCRSTNSETTRGIYESTNKEIRLDENTDFLYIVDPNRDSNLNYFYQGNLKEYAEELNKQGKQYKNSNSNWIKDYIGTIVVPIQIQHKRLYDSPLEDSLHIIGFLCIDSLS